MDRMKAIGAEIGTGQAAKILGVHPSTIYRWVLKGRLPGRWVGGRLRVRPEDLAAACRPVPAPEGSRAAEATRREREAWTRRELERLGMGRYLQP